MLQLIVKMSKHIEAHKITFAYLKTANANVITAVITNAPVSLIYAFSEIAFNIDKKTKILKRIADKKVSMVQKRKLLKPLIVKQLIRFYEKHYGA